MPARRAAWVLEATKPALVLGSSQPDTIVDAAAAARAGIEIVRRRSGGGAVLLIPGECLWIDVILPASDPLWDDDVNKATHWLGEVWADALASLGVPASVHRGGMEHTAWSRQICFAGVGPGEVTSGFAKLVGISQRRTRGAARFQCAALAKWDPAPLLDLLGMLPDERADAVSDLAFAVATVAAPLSKAEEAFLHHLRQR